MKQEQINQYKAAAWLGLLPDEENPLFIFNGTDKELLISIANGTIDAKQLATMELRNRGWDIKTGKWVGRKESKKGYQAVWIPQNPLFG